MNANIQKWEKAVEDATDKCETVSSETEQVKTDMEDYLKSLPETIKNMFADLGLILQNGKLCTKVVRTDEQNL